MEQLQILIAGLTAIVLFIFGLEHFSAEIERVTGDRFRRVLARATRLPVFGVLLGALVTAIIQSSSATSVIAISLVNAGVLSFKNSVGIIFGSNVGTTVTAQLVAFKLTEFAPLLIIVGFFMSLMRSRWTLFGKPVFYIGFVFFSLNLIASSLAPLQESEALVDYLIQPQNPLLAILAGCLFTALLQSSSVTTGLAIIFAQQGLLSLENAVPLIMGANIGTTATALLAMFNMDLAAKKTALCHFLFNVGGVVLFLPVFLLFGDRLNSFGSNPAVALANIHMIFNIASCLIFLALIGPFTRLVESVMGEGKMDFERIDLPKHSPETPFAEQYQRLEENLLQLFAFLQENYNLVTLGIESNYRSVQEAAERRIEYIAFLERDVQATFSQFLVNTADEEESRQLMNLFTRYDYLFQIEDSIEDLFNTKVTMDKQFIELRSDVMLMVREVSSRTLHLFDMTYRALSDGQRPETHDASVELRGVIDAVNRDLLRLMRDPRRQDVGVLSHFLTYSRRVQDKLQRFGKIAGRSIAPQTEPGETGVGDVTAELVPDETGAGNASP
ncbi:MAG: Na/Pi cotransporter family protein [Halieaceae bacterium]|nr:Na/Pi cotransporter family protein [Halieaceae bacterium]